MREDATLRQSGEGIYSVVETNDSVVVAALNDAREVYVVWAYSYPTDTWSWQLPGGGSDGEEPELAGQRELVEETGIGAEKFECLGRLIVALGLLKERMAVVLATGVSMGSRPPEADDSDAVGEGKFVSLAEAAGMVARGEICDNQTIAGLYLVEKWLAEHEG